MFEGPRIAWFAENELSPVCQWVRFCGLVQLAVKSLDKRMGATLGPRPHKGD